MNEIKIADILDEAADLIDEQGWWNGGDTANDMEKNVCAGIAIMEVAGSTTPGKGEHNAAFDALAEFVGITPHLSGEVFDWNDRQKCKEDVTSALRDCAEKLRISHAG